jgi:hypothetical protein
LCRRPDVHYAHHVSSDFFTKELGARIIGALKAAAAAAQAQR